MGNLFSTKGRINRKTYIIFYSIVITLFVTIGLIRQFFFPTTVVTFKYIATLMLCLSPILYMFRCFTIKRLHDLDRPGSDISQFNLSWTLFYSLITKEGTYGKNQHGYPQS